MVIGTVASLFTPEVFNIILMEKNDNCIRTSCFHFYSNTYAKGKVLCTVGHQLDYVSECNYFVKLLKSIAVILNNIETLRFDGIITRKILI